MESGVRLDFPSFSSKCSNRKLLKTPACYELMQRKQVQVLNPLMHRTCQERSITPFHARVMFLPPIAFTSMRDDLVSCKADGGLISMAQLSESVLHNDWDASPCSHRSLCLRMSITRAWQHSLLRGHRCKDAHARTHAHTANPLCQTNRNLVWEHGYHFAINGKEREERPMEIWWWQMGSGRQ